MDLDQTQDVQAKERPLVSKLPIISLILAVVSIVFLLFNLFSPYIRPIIPLAVSGFLFLSLISGIKGYEETKIDKSYEKQKISAIIGIFLGMGGFILFYYEAYWGIILLFDLGGMSH